MGLLGKLIKTTIDIATLPIDVVSDVLTCGGATIDAESAVKSKFGKLGDDLEEIKEESNKL